MSSTADSIKEIFESREFKSDLEALSTYAANIKQEDPIVLFFAKYLSQKGHKVKVNKRGHDLVVDGISIEFKYHFDCDVPILTRDLNLFNGNVELLMNAVADGTYKPSFKVVPEIYTDMIVRGPDMFIWIICSRDIAQVAPGELDRVCMGTTQLQYNIGNPYDPSGPFLEVVDDFLENLQPLRRFWLEKTAIATNGWFPSTYHLRICDFALDDLPKLKRFATKERTKNYLNLLRAESVEDIDKLLDDAEARRKRKA